jgi:uncharacterized protein YndB with AHSA1/START domain
MTGGNHTHDEVSGTRREIGSRSIGAGLARTARIRRRYDAAIEDVWEACTDPDRIGRWLLPVTGDLRPGGTFQLEGNASGEILRCEPPRLLAVTWVYAGRDADEVELRLAPGDDGGTVLEIEHASVHDVFRNDPKSGMWGLGTGWEMGLFALEKHLGGELAEAPAEADRPPPPEVVELAERSGRAWAALVDAADAANRPEI